MRLKDFLLSSKFWALCLCCLIFGMFVLSVSGISTGLSHYFSSLLDGPRGDQVKKEKVTKNQRGLSYIGGHAKARREEGITVNVTSKTDSGLNLYVSGHAPKAYLINMQGKILHEWFFPYKKAFPNHPPDPDINELSTFWTSAHLLPDGSLIAIYNDLGMIKIDRDSNLVWKRFNRAHHDLSIRHDGVIYVLTKSMENVDTKGSKIPYIDEYVSMLDPSGKLIRKVSILEAVLSSQYSGIVRKRTLKGELLHSNSIEILRETYPGLPDAFRKGNVLLSLNYPSNVVVLNPENNKIVWALPSMSNTNHDATLLPDGNLLFFNNNVKQGERVGNSEVVEIDPRTQEVKWSYGEGESFFSRCCGTNQRLTNGNTLITESQDGRAIEVTPGGKIVWEFINPHRLGRHDEIMPQLFEVRRIQWTFVRDWLSREES